MDSFTERLAARLAWGIDEPISQVIVDEIWHAVVEGGLESGERLPTSRQLAVHLGVAPRVVERAYAELEARGVVATRAGEGTFISLQPPLEAEHERHRELAELCREAFERAARLGFRVDDVIDLLAEYRTIERIRSEEEGRR